MNIAIVGDVVPGTCLCVPYPPGPYPATGTITSSGSQWFSNGLACAQVTTSVVSFPCGTAIIAGATMINSGGMPLARTGDSVSGCATGVVVGSTTITSM